MFDIPIWTIWLILSGFLFIIEIFTISFIMFWPAIAAFVAFILSILGLPLQIQIAVFSILSILLIVLTKPLTKKLFKTNDTHTNIKTIIGKTGIVLKQIDNLNSRGQIKVAGEIWSAISIDNDIIDENSNVEVISIDGVKVKVKKI